MSYQIKKTLTGGYAIKFDCPSCKVRLTATFEEAGQQDVCPQCGGGFTIPAKDKLDSYNAQIAELAAQKAAEEVAEAEAAAATEAARALEKEQERLAEQDRIAEEATLQAAVESSMPQEYEQDGISVDPYQPPKSHPAQFTTVSNASAKRYPVLAVYATIMMVIGYSIMALGASVFLVGVITAATASTESELVGFVSFTSGLFSFLVFVLSGSAFVIVAELVKVLLAIEANTHDMLERSRQSDRK